MTYILAKFSLGWADETHEEGFAIFTPEEWEIQKEKLSEPRTFYFGTNEGWEDEVFLDSIRTIEITQEDYDVLKRLFPDVEKTYHTYVHEGKEHTYTNGGSYGTFPLDVWDEEEDEE